MRLLHLYPFASNIKIFFRYLVAYKVPFLLDTGQSRSATSDTIIENQVTLVGICSYKPPYKVYGLLSRMMIVAIVLFIHSDYTCRVLFVSNLCFCNSETTIAPILPPYLLRLCHFLPHLVYGSHAQR